MAGKRILVVDDEATIRSLLQDLLSDEGYDIVEAKTGREALSVAVQQKPDLILTDVRLPDLTGLEVLERLKTARSTIPVVLMTAFGTSNTAIRGMQLGAMDYITKPFELDELVATIHKVLREDVQQQGAENVGKMLDRDPNNTIIGHSSKMLDVYRLIGRIANSDVTVMITGETGTGKELVANAIHHNSMRRAGPFIKVACAALPESILESELFGHEKGAFTSAIVQHKGRFELADKGTIFLDEVGEMTLSTQKKLLRVLQEREFERVGGLKPISVDVRVVAATNKRLEDEVEAGRFRQDLYYRLNVIAMHLPPLRERMDDVPTLVEYFLDKHRATPQSPPARISQDALDELLRHTWPGNVRELQNVIERAVALCGGKMITSDTLHLHPTSPERNGRATSASLLDHYLSAGMSLSDALADLERQLIARVLETNHGNRTLAAKQLGLSRRPFYSKMKQYGLVASDEDPEDEDSPMSSAN